MAGQDESVDLARPAPLCLLFVSGGWDYFNNGGSLTFSAPQFVSGWWDNKNMRTKLASGIVILGLFGSSMASTAPASAVLGLSKCEKVHKEVKTIESKFLSDYRNIRANPVDDDGTSVLALTPASIVLIAKIRTNDPIPKIWKIGFNNPKCFTNTQNLQIKSMKNKTISNYFDYTPWNTYSSSAKCKNLYANGKRYDQSTSKICITSRVQKWLPIMEYKSIYLY